MMSNGVMTNGHGDKENESDIEVSKNGYMEVLPDESVEGGQNKCQLSNGNEEIGTEIKKEEIPNKSSSILERRLMYLETCVQCDKRVNEQFSLNCKHSFCVSCLNSKTTENIVTCYICRKDTELPKDGLRALQPNLAVLIYRILINKMREKNKDPQTLICDICKIGETNCYCRNCDMNMCEQCKMKHGLRSQLAEHVVHTLSELKEGLLRKEVVKCDIHLKEVEYVCTHHIKLMCSVCVHFAVCGGDHDEKILPIKTVLAGNRTKIRKKSQQIMENCKALENYYKSAQQSQEDMEIKKLEIEEQHEISLKDFMKKIDENKKKLVMRLEALQQEVQVCMFCFEYI